MIFSNAMAEIKAHNADKTQTWTKGVNKFTDMTKQEFNKMLGYSKAKS